jgi:Protein of unknown function (DUF1579)
MVMTPEGDSCRGFGSTSRTGPKPGLEVKKLDYFVGRWSTEGMIAQGPWGAGGKIGWTETTEWMSGNFFVIGHWDFKMPPELGGDGKEIFLIGYDTNQNVYTFDAFSSQGRHQASRGTVSGDVWAWMSEAVYDGQNTKQKMTMKILSPTSYSLKFEVSLDGTAWMTFMEGKATKK